MYQICDYLKPTINSSIVQMWDVLICKKKSLCVLYLCVADLKKMAITQVYNMNLWSAMEQKPQHRAN